MAMALQSQLRLSVQVKDACPLTVNGQWTLDKGCLSSTLVGWIVNRFCPKLSVDLGPL